MQGIVHDALVDRFSRRHTYLRISLTDRCNLRCTYCMPEHMVWARPSHLMTTDEIVRLGRLFVSLGIDKIRLTGGEPTLHKDLVAIVAELSRLEGLRTLAMTTNAVKLAPMAEALRAAGLTGLTVSLDSLRRDRFERMARRDRLPDVLAGIDAALDAGFAPLKLNVVVMAGVNDDELLDFVAWADGRALDLRFIEYMPFPGTGWSAGGLLPFAEMKRRIEEHYQLTALDDGASAVGKRFAIAGSRTSVSFISSMTESFCATCNRLRLTADGNVKACLFHEAEVPLLGMMRDGAHDADLIAAIGRAVDGKPHAHAPVEELMAEPNRAMIAIGG